MPFKHFDSPEKTERRFQGALRFAMGLLGWLLPDTSAVVKATNQEDENSDGELPDELKDPFVVLDRKGLSEVQQPENCSDGSEVTVESSSRTLPDEEDLNAD